MAQSTLRIAGMTCTLCSLEIEKSVLCLEGITKITVSYASEKAHIDYDESKVCVTDIIHNITKLGFAASENIDQVDSAASQYQKSLKNKLIVSALLASPMIFMMLLMGAEGCHKLFDPEAHTILGKFSIWANAHFAFLHNWKFQMILATPIQFFIGAKFYRSAIKSIRLKAANMDVLVALGTTATYFYSIYVGFMASPFHKMPKVYFETGATVITLVLLGKYLESCAKDKTSNAIKTLMELTPKKVTLLKDGIEIEIESDLLQKGDLVIVRPGEKIPTDGTLLEGNSYVDESMLTGESMALYKSVGDSVTGGSINKNGSFTFQAEKIGQETFLSQIITRVEEAQSSRAPVQRLADKICSIFVPTVILISIVTFLIWFYGVFSGGLYIIEQPIMYAVAVLVVSCPCALGLATPTAIMVGMGNGAKKGILIKNGEELERMCRVNTVIFDKTGTLTEGKLHVSDTLYCQDLDSAHALFLTAIAEKKSEHPLGQAFYHEILDRSSDAIPNPDQFEALPGKGVIAFYENQKIVVGNAHLMESHGVDISIYQRQIDRIQLEGSTTIFSCIDGKLALIIGLNDVIKSNAKEIIDTLHLRGISTYMITGDNKKTALSVAKKLGISNVIAEVLPDQKAEEIKKLKALGLVTAMVGDGINDAPALAAADIGIAMGTGTSAAIESGDVILLKGDLTGVPNALKLSQKTMQKIKQNLFWAFIYNLIGIPFAALGFLTPELAALLMAFSSVSVLLNSLSLKRVEI